MRPPRAKPSLARRIREFRHNRDASGREVVRPNDVRRREAACVTPEVDGRHYGRLRDAGLNGVGDALSDGLGVEKQADIAMEPVSLTPIEDEAIDGVRAPVAMRQGRDVEHRDGPSFEARKPESRIHERDFGGQVSVHAAEAEEWVRHQAVVMAGERLAAI